MSRHRRTETQKSGSRRWENNKVYAFPLPITFEQPTSIFSLFVPRLVVNPSCEGIFDPVTRSVWITNSRDSMILWRRGFFGKGDLSRSEPSWLSRQINARKAALSGKMTSEEVTAKRRRERQQFKLDRAKAIAAAAAEAEAAFAEGRESASTIVIPSGATWKPEASFVDENLEMQRLSMDGPEDVGGEEEEEEEEEILDVEHLQLTLQEAFFLIWSFNCLSILDPDTNEPMSLQHIWHSFHSCHLSPVVPPSIPFSDTLRPDNPFLVNYVIYHHYRSLGWVVKSGIKFCVDYLLYKRGPVFNHAEFALVVCPVYEDPLDQKSSPYDLQNASPFTWSWLSTINRVNSQVMKTLILSYVTVPSQSRIPPAILSSPACLPYYSVREVTVRRFIPARMRD